VTLPGNSDVATKSEILEIKALCKAPATTTKIEKTEWKKCIPAQFAFELIFWLHNVGSNHSGRDVLVKEAAYYGSFWGLRSLAEWILKNCECPKAKSTKVATVIHKRENYDPGWYHIDLTFCNSEIILMFVCRMDRVLYTTLLSDKKAETTKDAVKKYIEEYDIHLTTLFSDNGGEFTGKNFKDYIFEIERLLENEGKEFRHLQSLPVSPHMNGMVENLNRIKRPIRMWISENPSYKTEDLVKKLGEVTSTYNNTTHSILGMSPLEFKRATVDEVISIQLALDTGGQSKDNLELRLGKVHMLMNRAQENYEKALLKTEKSRNRGKSIVDFEVGEKIKVSSVISKDRGIDQVEVFTKLAIILELNATTMTVEWTETGGYLLSHKPKTRTVIQRAHAAKFHFGDEQFVTKYNETLKSLTDALSNEDYEHDEMITLLEEDSRDEQNSNIVLLPSVAITPSVSEKDDLLNSSWEKELFDDEDLGEISFMTSILPSNNDSTTVMHPSFPMNNPQFTYPPPSVAATKIPADRPSISSNISNVKKLSYPNADIILDGAEGDDILDVSDINLPTIVKVEPISIKTAFQTKTPSRKEQYFQSSKTHQKGTSEFAKLQQFLNSNSNEKRARKRKVNYDDN